MIFERKQRYRHSIFEIYRFLSYTNTGYDLALAEHYDNRFVLWHPHTLTGGRRIFKFPIRHRSMPGEGKRETLFPFSRPIKSTLFSLSFFSFRQIEPANSNEPPLKRSLFKTLKERKKRKKERGAVRKRRIKVSTGYWKITVVRCAIGGQKSDKEREMNARLANFRPLRPSWSSFSTRDSMARV